MEPLMLYHYTDIDSLQKILESKTIRFNNLKELDDSLEIIDFNADFNKSTYVSCWTNDSEESIPLWHMYSRNLSGIRLEMKRDMFMTISGQGIPVIERVNDINVGEREEIPGTTLLELDKMGMSTIDFKPRLVEVEYIRLETLKLLHQSLYIKDRNNQTINTSLFGRYKTKDWAFQKEWRFVVMLNPFTLQELNDFNQENLSHFNATQKLLDLSDFIRRKYESNNNIPSQLFLPLDVVKLNSASITLGPCISDFDKAKVYEIIEQQGLEIKVYESQLKIACKGKDKNI